MMHKKCSIPPVAAGVTTATTGCKKRMATIDLGVNLEMHMQSKNNHNHTHTHNNNHKSNTINGASTNNPPAQQ